MSRKPTIELAENEYRPVFAGVKHFKRDIDLNDALVEGWIQVLTQPVRVVGVSGSLDIFTHPDMRLFGEEATFARRPTIGEYSNPLGPAQVKVLAGRDGLKVVEVPLTLGAGFNILEGTDYDDLESHLIDLLIGRKRFFLDPAQGNKQSALDDQWEFGDEVYDAKASKVNLALPYNPAKIATIRARFVTRSYFDQLVDVNPLYSKPQA